MRLFKQSLSPHQSLLIRIITRYRTIKNLNSHLITLLIILTGIISASTVFATDASPAIKTWQDVRNAIPKTENVVYIASAADFYLVGNSILKNDKDSLTGWTATMDSFAPWCVQYQFPMFRDIIQYPEKMLEEEKMHTVYLLVRKTRHYTDKFSFDFGLYPEPDAAKFGPAETVFSAKHLKPMDWTLVRIGTCAPSHSSWFYNSSPITIAAIILTSDYIPVPRIGHYITPNGDGLNDLSTIRVPVNPGRKVGVSIIDATGKAVAVPLAEKQQKTMLLETAWNGKIGKNAAPAGYYGVRISIEGNARDYPDSIMLEQTEKLKPVKYSGKTDYFPIGFYMDGDNSRDIPADPAEAAKWYDRQFTLLQQSGFNNMTIVWPKAGHAEVILAAAEKHKIKVMLTTSMFGLFGGDPRHKFTLTEPFAIKVAKDLTGQYGKYPALIGHIIGDEPTHYETSRWLTDQRVLFNVDPTRFAYSAINDPGLAMKFAQSTQFHNVSVDIYPLYANSNVPIVLKTYFQWVQLSSAVSPQRPAWIVAQAFAGAGSRLPSIEEARALTWIALAGGAKGFIYFLYQSMAGIGLTGVVDESGNPSPLFYELSRQAKRITPQMKLLLDLLPAKIGASVGDGFVHGEFVDSAGKHYLIVASLDTTKPANAQIRLPESCKYSIGIDVMRNSRLSNKGGAITCELAAGDGVIIRLEGK